MYDKSCQGTEALLGKLGVVGLQGRGERIGDRRQLAGTLCAVRAAHTTSAPSNQSIDALVTLPGKILPSKLQLGIVQYRSFQNQNQAHTHCLCPWHIRE